MVDVLFEKGTWQITTDMIYGPIQTRSVSRTIMPVETILQEKDNQFEYWTWAEDYNSVYQQDPGPHPNVSHTLAPTTKNVPLIETGFVLNRADKARADASKLNIQGRINAIAPKIAQDEDMFAIYGDATQDVTSFADTTNNSTAITTELNVTTEALMKSTLVTGLDQLGTAMGGLENLKSFPIMLGVSNDVHAKMIKTGITGYLAADRADSVLDIASIVLNKYGGPGSGVWHSALLGATVTKTSADKYDNSTPGALNAVLYPWDVEIASIVASPFNVLSVDHAIHGMEIDMTERWVPVFRQKALVLYGGTTVIA